MENRQRVCQMNRGNDFPIYYAMIKPTYAVPYNICKNRPKCDTIMVMVVQRLSLCMYVYKNCNLW